MLSTECQTLRDEKQLDRSLVQVLKAGLAQLQEKVDAAAEEQGKNGTLEETNEIMNEKMEAVQAERDSLRLKLAAQEEEHVVEATNALQEVGGALQCGRMTCIVLLGLIIF